MKWSETTIIHRRFSTDMPETILKIPSKFLDMETFEFSGRAKLGEEWQKFNREVEAESREHAKQKLLSQLGSEQGIPRGKIELE